MKRLVLILILIILFFLGLTGCTKNTNTSNHTFNFVGTWENVKESIYNETWIFYANESLRIIQEDEVEGEIITSVSWFIYAVNKTNLCFSSIDYKPESPNYYHECFEYEISSNNNHLVLTFNEIIVFELNKI